MRFSFHARGLRPFYLLWFCFFLFAFARVGQPWHLPIENLTTMHSSHRILTQPFAIFGTDNDGSFVASSEWIVHSEFIYALALGFGADFRAPLRLTSSFMLSSLSFARWILFARIFDISECDRSRFRIIMRSIFRRGVSVNICCGILLAIVTARAACAARWVANCLCSFSRLVTISRIALFSIRIECRWATES